MLDNTPSEPSKFKIKNWVEINDHSPGTYNTNSQIKFKTTMSTSSSCGYNYVYILFEGTITVVRVNCCCNKQAIFKNSAPFTNCITETNNTEVGNAKDIDVNV